MHDVLADVMHIALHRGEQNLASVGDCRSVFRLVQIGGEDIHRLLHRARGLHHLRQEHLALAKPFAYAVHAFHQRAGDNLHRHPAAPEQVFYRRLQWRCISFLQGVYQDGCTVFVLPLLAVCPLRGKTAFGCLPALLHLRRARYQSLGSILAAVEKQVLDGFAQVGRDVRILYRRGGIHYRHVHAALHGVVEEDGMDGFAQVVIAAERKRQVAHAAGDSAGRQVLVYPFGSP